MTHIQSITCLFRSLALVALVLPGAEAQDVTLSFGNVDTDAGTAEILFSNTVAVAGFQFDISEITLDTVCCGAAAAASFNIGFNPANGRVLCYGVGTSIPAGPERVLLELTFHCDSGACAGSSTTCISGAIFADPSANSLSVQVGPCVPLHCDAVSFCAAAPNSAGAGARLDMAGSLGIADNDLVLQATGCPTNQFGIFYYGSAQVNLPFGNGTRCVGGQLFRFPPVSTGTGTATYAVDNSSPPQPAGQLSAYSSWNFQYWYRDPVAGGAYFNLSDGLHLTFCP